MSDEVQTPEPEVTIDSAVESAAQTINAEPTEPATSEQPESGSGEAGQEDIVPSDDNGGVAPPPNLDAETQRAVDFYKALQDPERGPAFLEFIANQAGLKVSRDAAPARQEVVEKEPTIAELIKNELGEDYAFLGDKLGPALDKAINKIVAPLQQELLRTRVDSEIDRAITTLNSTHTDFKNYESQIGQLLQKMPAGQGISSKEHLENLYFIAKARAPQPPTPPLKRDAAKAMVEKINKNAKENMPSPSAASANRVVRGPALPTLEEALDAALKGEVFE